MRIKITLALTALVNLLSVRILAAQDLGPQIQKIKDGIYVYVGKLVKAGKSLDEIKKELKIAGTEDWEGKDRFANNIEAAYRSVAK